MGTTDKERDVYRCQHCGNVSFGRSASDSGEGERPSTDASAIERPELAVVLREVFGISETGIRICVFLMEDGESTAGELADHLELDRSTVSRQLNQLTDIGLLEKRQRLLSEGGYVHVYSPVDVEEVRQRLTVGLHAWMDEALELVEDVNREKVAALARADHDESDSTGIYWDE
ncbi:helix-turn-helix domain-containing protein [Halorussus sp. MSC15.2]|uniref:helix-turn-helix domain-containing protein n=1 Tax=Halorussus sp. MSC15.2 TaxID=2283638 RepID=UPI0013D5AB8F|nr:helix-turn-helix domain-containing protein [Halorussus sp. MSC15.2]NEU58630.1 ArsR family transcriptional regulator [Halorussus sp. MSC15.2]